MSREIEVQVVLSMGAQTDGVEVEVIAHDRRHFFCSGDPEVVGEALSSWWKSRDALALLLKVSPRRCGGAL